MNPTVVVLHGDQTGEELLQEAVRLLEQDVIGFKVDRRDFDLSLERRRQTRNQVVLDAAAALRECGYGLKAATITPEGSGDVGSPNAILRKQIDGRVIVRTGRLRRQGVARGSRPGRVGLPHGEDQPAHVQDRRRVRLHPRQAD